MTTNLERLRGDRRVDIVDDERNSGNGNGNGVIVTLRQGWSFDPLQDNRVMGADTVTEACALLARAQKFAGPYTD